MLVVDWQGTVVSHGVRTWLQKLAISDYFISVWYWTGCYYGQLAWKSNLQKMFTVTSWETSEWPTLTAFLLCIVRVSKKHGSHKYGYTSIRYFLVPVQMLQIQRHWKASFMLVEDIFIQLNVQSWGVASYRSIWNHRCLLEWIIEHGHCGLWWDGSLLLYETACTTFFLGYEPVYWPLRHWKEVL